MKYILLSLKFYFRRDVIKNVRHRVNNFYTSVVNIYTPDEFKMHFRMTRITTEVVYNYVCEALNEDPEPTFCDYIPGNERRYVILT